MEVTDWDLSTIVLFGLDTSTTPSSARKEVELGSVTPQSDAMVRYQLKTSAVLLYNHQKLVPVYREQVTDGKNTLAYFVCTLFEPSLTASLSQHDPRPKLRTAKPLPLERWDRLYYVVHAEIRRLYTDLQQRFGQDFGAGKNILHYGGQNGANEASMQPVSAVRMAHLLETLWTNLMDPSLIAALDRAVRMEAARDMVYNESAANGRAKTIEEADLAKFIEHAVGLRDVNDMAPSKVLELVWSRQTAEASSPTGQSVEEQSLLASCRAEIVEAAIAGRRSCQKAVLVSSCEHGASCHCEKLDITQVDEHSRAHGHQASQLVSGEHDIDSVDHGSPSQAFATNLLGALTKGAMQMQVAALPVSDPYIVRTCYSTSEAANELDKQILEMHRARSDGEDLHLAYVPPPRTPSSRTGKDIYPLGFYGGNSGQRYPTLRPSIQAAPPPEYGKLLYNTGVPLRKPVPPSTASTCQVTYPTIPVSHSQGLFAPRSPDSTSSVRRHTNPDTTVSAETYSELAAEVHNTIRPFSEDTNMQSLIHAPSRPTMFASAEPRATSFERNKPHPPLPLAQLDFISPRPALKQRYVSAGGTAKLADRAEIAGPSFVQTQSGASMAKDELFERLNDPEFVKRNFGEGAVGFMEPAQQRRSDEVKVASEEELNHDPVASLIKHAKRERTQSGSSGSGRFEKLKKVFARRSSGSE